ncbi:MAG: tetratricopeptide repeat protein [Gemmatimonadaceae bacterium]
MAFWDRLFGGRSDSAPSRQRLDYLNEALVLERQGDYDAAVTSYRLALRERPDDLRILQNMAIALSKIGRIEEAIRSYKKAVDIDPTASGAHYGLAFLLVKRGDVAGATKHLEAFLSHPPAGDDAERFVGHARATLDQLRGGDAAAPAAE